MADASGPTQQLRRLAQPGPAARERVETLEGCSRAIPIELQPGLSLNDSVAAPLLAAGAEAAAVVIEGGSFDPFVYVIPSVSSDPSYAAYYSEPFAPPGETRLEIANLTFGRRDGQPFVHCHAVWIEPDGSRRAGHIMPHETMIASSPKGVAWSMSDAAFRSEYDPETNFTLFHPVPVSAKPLQAGPRTVIARILPNEDVTESLEAICRRHGFSAAVLRGSVGSVIDPRFTSGHSVRSDSTELLVRSGHVVADENGGFRTEIDIILVDTAGNIHEGKLVPHQNPVCITFELMLEEHSPGE